MRKPPATALAWLIGMTLASPLAGAPPERMNHTQKGSLLMFPLIDTRATPCDNTAGCPYKTTMVRIANDANTDTTLQCYYRNNAGPVITSFQFDLVRHTAVWFNAFNGAGTTASPVTGFGKDAVGELVCWARDAKGPTSHNHLVGAAIVFDPVEGTAFEYDAASFTAGSGIAKASAVLPLNGLAYSACADKLIGQFTPAPTPSVTGEVDAPGIFFERNTVVIATCTQDASQTTPAPVKTRLLFTVWNADGVMSTGAWKCIDTWDMFDLGSLITAARSSLFTASAYFRVESRADETLCPGSQSVGLVGIQSTVVNFPGGAAAAAGVALDADGARSGTILIQP